MFGGQKKFPLRKENKKKPYMNTIIHIKLFLIRFSSTIPYIPGYVKKKLLCLKNSIHSCMTHWGSRMIIIRREREKLGNELLIKLNTDELEKQHTTKKYKNNPEY